jgi:hypothetical protein
MHLPRKLFSSEFLGRIANLVIQPNRVPQFGQKTEFGGMDFPHALQNFVPAGGVLVIGVLGMDS